MTTAPFVPFDKFVESLKQPRMGVSPALRRRDSGGRAEDDKMRAHLRGLYEGLRVEHSFQLQSGDVVDCIPLESQVALRGSKGIASPPGDDVKIQFAGTTSNPVDVGSLSSHSGRDDHGNERSCPEGYVPVRRMTMDELSRARTLRSFLARNPVGARATLRGRRALGAAITRCYATARLEEANQGGYSTLNIWRPELIPAGGFSLSQIWITGGSGNAFQSVECGWQVYPDHYRSRQPALFIYWTADGYGNTGAYNLEDGKFCQRSHKWILGAPFPDVSVRGGRQFELRMGWRHHTDGNWWLAIQAGDQLEWIGYYPGLLFGQGQLSRAGQSFSCGGETYGASIAEMGSGLHARAGYGYAAYQRAPAFNGIDNELKSANLSPSDVTSGYSLAFGSSGTFNEPHFFFGGPRNP